VHRRSLSTELSTTVAQASRVELPAEILEFGIDQVMESGILRDAPFVGWIAKGMEIRSSISDQLFFKKILRFLTQLKSLGDDEKKEFSQKVESDPAFREKVGDRLLLALDRLDEPAKSEFLARCFDCFLTGHLSYEEFSELAQLIDRSLLHDLEALEDSTYRFKESDFMRLVSCGLSVFKLGLPLLDEGVEIKYSFSRGGILLQKAFQGGLKEFIEEERET